MFQGVWGDLGISVVVYSSVAGVIGAYESACQCNAPPHVLPGLQAESVAEVPSILLVAMNSFLRSQSRTQQLAIVTHAQLHAVQKGFTPDGVIAPVWMFEGGAEYTVVDVGIFGDVHPQNRTEAQTYGSLRLNDVENWPAGTGPGTQTRAPYSLGHFATHVLISRNNRRAVLDYWQRFGSNRRAGMPVESAWRDALQAILGISVEQFYAEFEDYRRRGLPISGNALLAF